MWQREELWLCNQTQFVRSLVSLCETSPAIPATGTLTGAQGYAHRVPSCVCAGLYGGAGASVVAVSGHLPAGHPDFRYGETNYTSALMDLWL